MDKNLSKIALQKAIAKFTTLSGFANAMGVKYQVVQQWLINGVPLEYCPGIQKLTGVPCEELNSGLDWAYLRKSQAQTSES